MLQKASEGIEVVQKMVAQVISTELRNIKTVRMPITRSAPLFVLGGLIGVILPALVVWYEGTCPSFALTSRGAYQRGDD